jgi:hypothetical protein
MVNALHYGSGCRGILVAPPICMVGTIGRGLLGLVLLGGWLPSAAKGATVGLNCPEYVAHLRSARAYLARGNRQDAAEELREAKKALDSCARTDATGDAVTASSAALASG